MPRIKTTANKRRRASRSDSPPTFIVNFPSLQASKEYNTKFSTREVNPGRFFDLDTLEFMNFEFLSTFRQRNWLPVLQFKIPVLLDYVRMFYSNASNLFNNQPSCYEFKTFLNNTHFEINPEIIAQFLNIPNTGDFYEACNFNSLEASRFILNNPLLQNPLSKVSDLSVDLRVLHSIVCQVLHPRKGNFARIYSKDIWFMERIVKNVPINLPLMICSKMVNDRPLKDHTLPYGCLISAFLQHRFPHIQSSSILPVNKLSIFNQVALIKMGFVYDPIKRKYVKTVEYMEAHKKGDHQVDDTENTAPQPEIFQNAGSSSQVNPDPSNTSLTVFSAGFSSMSRSSPKETHRSPQKDIEPAAGNDIASSSRDEGLDDLWNVWTQFFDEP